MGLWNERKGENAASPFCLCRTVENGESVRGMNMNTTPRISGTARR